MGRDAHTTNAEMNVILKLKFDGLSFRKIAQLMKYFKHKVLNMIHYSKNIAIRGRKTKTSKRLNQILIRHSKKTPPLSHLMGLQIF